MIKKYIKTDSGTFACFINSEFDKNKVSILFFAGMGINSAYLDFYTVLNYVDKNKFNLITVDMLGAGFSKYPLNSIRSLENISNEFIKLLNKLNLSKYFIISHSFNSIYWLYLINNYPLKIKGFIGIDPSVPMIMKKYKNELKDSLAEIKHNKHNPKLIDTDINPNLSKEMQTKAQKLYEKISGNENEINELEQSLISIEKTLNLKINKKLPTLSILSTFNYADYKQFGNPYFNKNKKSTEIILNGHHFLQWIQAKQIAFYLTNFIFNVIN